MITLPVIPARQAFVAARLRGRGYPLALAMRVALTPPLILPVEPSVDDDSRPGRELAEGVERHFGTMVRMFVAETGGAL